MKKLINSILMPRLIVKCRYYQQSKLHTNIAGMLSYIAKREGVEKLEDSWKSASHGSTAQDDHCDHRQMLRHDTDFGI